jgi:hypothetical protein
MAMNTLIRTTLFALAASIGVATTASAQVAPRFDVIEVAAEVLASWVTLPRGPDSSLVMPACGDCPPKSYRVTAATAYYIGDQPVTLGELAAAVGGRPLTPMTVMYSAKTGVITRVTADIAAPTGSR